ncbi:MAG: phosphotransferase [Gammaproteobacteria bacterium]|nr:phosphotransferase [Gammaproteobacteria bacterium]
MLLPLRRDARALLIGAEDTRFIRHLAGELGELHTVGMATAPLAATQATSSCAGIERRLVRPEGLYDLVFSASLEAARYLSPGGTLCCLRLDSPSREPLLVDDLRLVGRWRAFPSWPDFRVLIPERAAGWRAAVRGLRLLPLRSWTGLLAQLHPALAAWKLPGHGIALYRRQPEPASSPASLLEAADAALSSAAGRPREAADFDPMAWVAVSGRLGPGNPILAFHMDRCGQLRRLIKLARYPGAEHLPLEARKLETIEGALGPELATRVIRPTASTPIDGRAALAYDYVPTFAFFGLRWRWSGRRRFCRAMTAWLAAVALVTRREDDPDVTESLHRGPLRALIERGILPSAMQAEARQALAWLDAQATLPTVLEHGDLGIYNTRMTAGDGSDFRVLDWGSSTFDGIALGDLAYLLSSARAPGKLGSSCLRQYLQELDLPETAAAPLWFAYLARRWAELDTVRLPVDGDPGSGGGVLLSIHAQIMPYLDRLASR